MQELSCPNHCTIILHHDESLAKPCQGDIRVEHHLKGRCSPYHPPDKPQAVTTEA